MFDIVGSNLSAFCDKFLQLKMAAKFSIDTKRVCLFSVIVLLLIHGTECSPSTCKLAQTCGQCIENPGEIFFN